MAKSSSMRSGSSRSDSDADRTLHRTGIREKSSGSLEILLLGLLSAGIAVLLFLVFFAS